MLRYFPVAILLVSLVLRLALAAQGGQYFFGDEGRYDRGLLLYRALAAGDTSAVTALAAQPEHTLFPWIGVVVSAGQHALAHLTPFGDWSHSEFAAFTIWIGAALLSIFSAVNLALLYRLARLAGAGAEEACWSLLLMAAANSAFYYSRHLLPYDCALTAALSALVLGLGTPTVRRALVTGLLTGATFHLYNGDWYVVPVVGLVFALAWRSAPSRLQLILAATSGLLLALCLPILLGLAWGGAVYWATLQSFSHSVTQGLFSEGWSLPWEYLWHAEGLLGAAVAVAIAFTLVRVIRSGETLPDRVRATLFALVAAYVLLVVFSCVLTRFVVYGRTIKPLLPALCLLGGWTLARQFAPRPIFKPFAATVIVLAATLQFWPHFTRAFPRETEIAVLRTWGNPKHVLTVSGSIYIPLSLPVARPDLALVNGQFLYPVRGVLDAPAGTTLLGFDHPLTYAPFQYEGHTPRERTLLRSTDLSMRLVKLAAPATVPDHPPAALTYNSSDRPTGR